MLRETGQDNPRKVVLPKESQDDKSPEVVYDYCDVGGYSVFDVCVLLDDDTAGENQADVRYQGKARFGREQRQCIRHA